MNKLRSKKGFTFIEILVALGILGAVLLPFLSFVSYRLSKEAQNDELLRAIEIIKMKTEEVLLLPEVKDNEEIIEEKYLLKIKILDGDQYDEPINLKPVEIHLSIFRLKNNEKLFELHALK
jgi:prepilin-type N-terminal cleavage/methylation domain-containing protein